MKKLDRRIWCRRGGPLALALASLLACSPGSEEVQRRDALSALTAQFQSRLDRIHEEARSTEAAFPGATAAFILPDGRVGGVATGYSDAELGVPMTPESKMPSGSIGKTYVAAVALSVAQEGALSLDDEISKWLADEDWFDRLPNGDEVTLRMLLNHSSGLRNHVFEAPAFHAAMREMSVASDRDRYLEPRELVEFILDTEPLFPPGDGFHYTDTGYILVGMILEKVTGTSYYELLETRFLEPLDLERTLPQDQRGVPGLAQGNAVRSAEIFGLPPKVVANGKLVFHPLVEWTGGGLFNNPQDLVRWGAALYEGAAMPGDYLDDLLRSVAKTGPDRPDRHYGLGVAIEETPLGTSYGHAGFFPGYLSTLRYFPDHGIAVAIQLNTDAEQPEHRMMPLVEVVLERVASRDEMKSATRKGR